MTQHNNVHKEVKQRLTAFVDPILVKRAKVRGALEGLTISEVVEKALDAYAPKLETSGNQHIKIKFSNYPVTSLMIPETRIQSAVVPKHAKALVVPR